MRKLSKTLLSLLLIAAMLASFVVLPAAAEEPAAEQPTEAVQAAETQAADSSFMKIFHLDCGRKYFTKDWILALINEISAAGYTHLQLALGNDGMRFLLDDMSLTVNGTTYSSENVAAAIHAGNEKYHDFTVDELTEKEMDAIIAHAKEKNIEILPLINTPGHMDAILDAATSLTYTDCAYNGSSRTIDVTNDTAVAFTQALLQKYVTGYSYASNWSNTRVCGTILNAESVVGATSCVWCDYPGAETEQEIAQKIRLPLRAMAQRMKGESVVLDENELVSGGFKADGTINTDVDVAEDAATGIKVSAPSVKTVDVTVKTDNLPEVTGAAEVLAWEITPRDADGNAYTGEGTVTLHIPEAWTGANVYGAVVNADGSLTTIKENVALDETNSTITFTVPHFSTVLAVKENKTEVINLTLGQTKSVSLKGEDLTGKITKATDFDTYASLNAAYTPSKTETKIGSKLSSLPTGTTIVLTDGKGNYAKLNSSDYLENTTAEAEATIWTIEKSGNNYYLKSGNNYLNPSNSFCK